MLHEITFRLQTPVIMSDALHLDALLMAVHPDAKCITAVNRDQRDGTIAQLPLPLARAECGGQWVWAAGSIELDDDAEPFEGRYKKAISLDDVPYLQKNVMTIGGIHKDRISRVAGFISRTESFLAESDDLPGLTALCSRITNIGKLRGMGYGLVTGMDIRQVDGDWKDCLVQDGRAMRNLPASFIEEEATEQIIAQPPYWGIYRREPGVMPGMPATLKKDVRLC